MTAILAQKMKKKPCSTCLLKTHFSANSFRVPDQKRFHVKNFFFKNKFVPLRVDRDGIVNWNKWPINGNSTECPGDGKVHESISLAAVSIETSPHSKNFLAITEVT